eukprot:2420674-Rhodomonas_salina.1
MARMVTYVAGLQQPSGEEIARKTARQLMQQREAMQQAKKQVIEDTCKSIHARIEKNRIEMQVLRDQLYALEVAGKEADPETLLKITELEDLDEYLVKFHNEIHPDQPIARASGSSESSTPGSLSWKMARASSLTNRTCSLKLLSAGSLASACVSSRATNSQTT